MFIKKLCCCCLFVGLMLPMQVGAQLDELQLRLLEERHGPALRWDNIEGGVLWLNDTDPTHNMAWGMHTLRLEAGESAYIRVPKQQVLRLFHADKTLGADDVDVFVSQGQPLLLELSAQQRASSLIYKAATSHDWIAKIQRPKEAKDSLEVAVFVSRLMIDRDLAPYRNLVSLGDASVLVDAGRTSRQQSFWRLPAGKKLAVTLQSARYMLESRLLFAQYEAGINQDYDMYLYVDAKLWRTVNMSTAAERKYPVLVQDQPTLTGELQQAFFELSEGQHQLEIASNQPLLLRMLQLEDPAWLFPALNSLQPSAQQLRDAYTNSQIQTSHWHLNRQKVTQLANASAVRAEQRELAAFHVVRNNAYLDGGLIASQLMQDAANQRLDAPEVQTVAQQLLGRHSFYRSLHPLQKAKQASFEYAYFHNKKLAPLKREERNLVVDARQRDSLLKNLAQAAFYQVPSVQEKAYVYHIPPRTAMSYLRIVLAEDEPPLKGKYFIQFDDQAAVQLVVDQHMPVFQTQASMGEAGLNILAQQFSNVSTLKGAFAAQRQALKLQSAASVAMKLPPHVQQIKLWSENTGSHRIALQYRASKPFTMSESGYLQALAQLNQDPLISFVGFLAQNSAKTTIGKTDDALAALQNSWLGLSNELHQHDQLFKANMVAPRQKTMIKLDWQALRQQAVQFETQQQWLLALENWSQLAKSEKHYHEAELKRIALLQLLNEGYLAELRMKALFVYGDDVLKKAAFKLLQQLYVDDHAALLRLHAVALLREPTVQHMQVLCRSFMAQGQYRKVMMLQLLLNAKDQNKDILVRAAWHLGWWQVLNDTIAQMPAEKSALWRGYRAQDLGKYQQAIQQWRKAGKAGQDLIQHLQDGQNIASHMQQPATYHVKKTLAQWEEWSQTGHKVWQEDKTSVIAFAGMNAIRSQATGRIMQAYRATKAQAVTMQVMGPLRIWLQLRLIHTDAQQPVLHDWVTIQEGKQQEHVLISNNQRSRGLSLIGQGASAVGRQKNVYYDVGAGLHEIHIQAEQHDLLIRPFVLRSEIALSVLPALSVQTLSDSMTTSMQLSLWNNCMATSCVERLQTGENLVLQHAQNNKQHTSRLENLLLHATEKAKVGKRVYRQPAPQKMSSLIFDDATVARLKANDVRSEITELLWQVEHELASEVSRVRALALVTAYPQFRASGTLLRRLQQGFQWQRLAHVKSSAGLHRTERRGWKPESPALRIRKSLMPTVPENSFVVYGYAQQGFAMLNHSPKQFIVESQNMVPEFIAKQMQTLQYSDGATLMYALQHGHNNIRIEKGEHSLLLGIEKPMANQFIQINVYEKKGRHEVAVPNQYERVYQVASKAEPIILKVHGPRWLRMDQYKAGRTYASYHAVSEGWHDIRLDAEAGQSLYRIYELIAKTDDRPVAMTVLAQPDITSAQPLLKLKKAKTHSLQVQDYFELGGQEDGTWSLGAGVFNQSIQDEDKNSQANKGSFAELSLSHRFYSEDQRLYHRATLLGRNQKAGTVFGLKERLDYAPMAWPVNVYLRASAFMQSPAWSGTVRVGMTHKREWDAKLYHRLGLELFARQLSDKTLPFLGVDRDVFSLYKKDHPYGLKLSDTWVHRPWLDTEYQARIFAISNQNISPDHVGLQLAWHQMLGHVQAKLQYQFRWFMADVNRANAYASNQFKLDVRGHSWQEDLDRLAWQLRFKHDFNQATSSVELQLFWHFSEGRVLRDFRKGELDFYDRYELSVPVQQQ